MKTNKYLVEYTYARQRVHKKYLKEAMKDRYGGREVMSHFWDKLYKGYFGHGSMKLKNLESFYPKHIAEEVYKKSRLKIMGVVILQVFKIHKKNLEVIPLWTLEEFIKRQDSK